MMMQTRGRIERASPRRAVKYCKFSNFCVELELERFPENKSEGPHRLILQVPGGRRSTSSLESTVATRISTVALQTMGLNEAFLELPARQTRDCARGKRTIDDFCDASWFSHHAHLFPSSYPLTILLAIIPETYPPHSSTTSPK
jgi:hypothetical protein